MRIALISLANLYLCPYINKYLEVVRDRAEFDVIYWDRHRVKESVSGVRQMYAYHAPMDEMLPRWKKLLRKIGFCRYARKLITDNHYDGVVILHTNAAILLHRTLEKYYKGRFILDIRDYSMEKNPVYFRIEERLVKISAVNFISSDGYRAFLPEASYHLVHNSTHIDPAFVQEFRKTRQDRKEPIRISFIGLIRFFDQNEKLASAFQNDDRFQLNYFGKNAENLKKRLAAKQFKNLEFHDQFPPEQTLDFYQKTDIINNAYGNQNMSLDYAYSNKLYYSAILGLPILVSPKTCMADIVTKYQLGFVFDPDDKEAPEKLYAYYTSIDWAQFDKNCAEFCRMVEKDELEFQQILKRFLSGGAE